MVWSHGQGETTAFTSRACKESQIFRNRQEGEIVDDYNVDEMVERIAERRGDYLTDLEILAEFAQRYLDRRS